MSVADVTDVRDQMLRRARGDRGFTLVELLIVIVILGILATVTVFAVRGITDDSEAAACAGEFRQIQNAQELHQARHGGYADEPTLAAGGSMLEESALYDTSPNGDGYDVTPANPSCTMSAIGVGGGVPAGGPTPPVAGSAAPPTAITFAGVPASEYGGSGADELLVFGRGEAAADWAATTATGMDVSRRVTFMDIDDIGTVARLDAAVSRANNTPPTAYALFVDDDVAAFGPHASFSAALADVLTNPGYDDGPVFSLDADAEQNLAWAFLQFP